MGKQKKEKTKTRFVPREAWSGLLEINLKLKGIAYLIYNQTNDPAPPLDLEEIQQGIGMLLDELAEEVHMVWWKLDEPEVAPAKKAESKERPATQKEGRKAT
jgi:hypothetical protein